MSKFSENIAPATTTITITTDTMTIHTDGDLLFTLNISSTSTCCKVLASTYSVLYFSAKFMDTSMIHNKYIHNSSGCSGGMLNLRIERPLCPRFLEKKSCCPWRPSHKSLGAEGKEAHTKKTRRRPMKATFQKLSMGRRSRRQMARIRFRKIFYVIWPKSSPTSLERALCIK